MTVKTITVTEDAYEALKAVKQETESFSQTILRVTRRRPLSNFFGVLSKESGERLEQVIEDMRKRRNNAHQKRLKELSKSLA